MKLTEFLEDIGRPISYYPALRQITGSTNATVLLCQFVYWRGKESDPDGWLYKESSEIEEETGLSYDEQKTARGKLKENGLLEEHYARLDHRMKFRLKLDAINEHWQKREQPIPENGITALAKAESLHSLIESETTSETTTENTPAAENSPPRESAPPIPETPVTYPEKKEEFTLTSSWGMAGAGEKVRNPAAAIALEANMKRQVEGAVDLGWLTEYQRPLIDAFVTASGIKPVKGDYGLWRKAAGNWLLIKLTTSDIVQAVQKLRAGNLTISGPQSVTNTARAIHCNPTGEQQGTLDSLERAGFTYGGS